MTSRFIAAVFLLLTSACETHDVTLELPKSGRALSRDEREALQQIADAAFRDVRTALEGLPPRLTLIVRFGKEVIPETGETGTAGYPGNVAMTIDPDRDVLAIIRNHVRPMLVHELNHLARKSRVTSTTLMDHVVSEGLATAFERDFAKNDPPWGKPPDDLRAWTEEILRQPEPTDHAPWISQHPDGRRWIGMRVGTALVDRASRNSGKSVASLVFTPSAEILRLAEVSREPKLP